MKTLCKANILRVSNQTGRYLLAGIFLLFFCLLVQSCKESGSDQAVETISVKPDRVSDYKDVIDHLRIVALSTTKDAYMASLNKVQVYDDYFFFNDNKDILFLFKRNGDLVSTSRRVMGYGKGEYHLCLDYSYNAYSKQIEVLVPGGILFFDRNFHFLRKVTFMDKELKSGYFDFINDLGENRHLLMEMPENVKKEEFQYYIYDSQKEKIILSKSYSPDCQYITMQRRNISDHDFLAFPCMNYTFYKINLQNYQLTPFVHLDFGEKAWDEGDIGGSTDIDKIRESMLKTKKSLALRTYKSGDMLVSLIKEGPRIENFKTAIINLKTKDVKVLKYDYGTIKIPFMDYYLNGVIYACVPAEKLADYVDEGLLDEESKSVFASRSDDSNYYMLEYYLK